MNTSASVRKTRFIFEPPAEQARPAWNPTLREMACIIVGMYKQNPDEFTSIFNELNQWNLSASEAQSIINHIQDILNAMGCGRFQISTFLNRLQPSARSSIMPAVTPSNESHLEFMESPVQSPIQPTVTSAPNSISVKGHVPLATASGTRKTTAAYYKEFLDYAPPSNENGGKPRVLIAEDDYICRESLSSRIRAAGNLVTAVGDGNEATQALSDHSFDLVILDMKLPGRHGLEILNQLARETERIPVILCSGFAEMSEFPEVTSYGPIRCCPKPVDGKRLVQFITDLLQKAS